MRSIALRDIKNRIISKKLRAPCSTYDFSPIKVSTLSYFYMRQGLAGNMEPRASPNFKKSAISGANI